MGLPGEKGNDPQRWQKLLDVLDEKLQFGLLDRVRKCSSYHFESEILFLQPGSEDDRHYLAKEHVLAQLQLFAQDATGVSRIQLTAE